MDPEPSVAGAGDYIGTALPIHLVLDSLVRSGLDLERIRWHSWLGTDKYFSDLVKADVEGAEGKRLLHLHVRHLGIAPILPPYMRKWIREADSDAGTDAEKGLRDFIGLLDHHVIKTALRIRTEHLRQEREDGLSLPDRLAVGVLGLNREDWVDESGRWSRQDLAAWYRLFPSILARARPLELIEEGLEAFFPFLERGTTLVVSDRHEECVPNPEEIRARLGIGHLLDRGPLLGKHQKVRFRSVRVHLGPLCLRDYWSFLPPGSAAPLDRWDVSTESAIDAREQLGPPGSNHKRLMTVLAHLLPAHVSPVVSLSVAPEHRTNVLGREGAHVQTLLGHNVVLGGAGVAS
jgi:Type VI secretion, TssG